MTMTTTFHEHVDFVCAKTHAHTHTENNKNNNNSLDEFGDNQNVYNMIKFQVCVWESCAAVCMGAAMHSGHESHMDL